MPLHRGGLDQVTRNARHAEEGHDGRDTRVRRALLVDDHRLFREVLAVVLEAQTDLKRNDQAGSLAEARRVWRHLPGEVDVAIVDFDLPNGEGISLIEDLREADPGIPVLALTASPNLEQRARALRVGANEVLSMGSTCEKITRVVQRLIGG